MTDALIKTEILKMRQVPIVELFELDLSSVGIPPVYFTNTSRDGTPISFHRKIYSPLPISATGFQWGSEGALPRPKLTLITKDLQFLNRIVDFNDFLGCTVKRIRTFEKYLDDVTSNGPHFPIEEYIIFQKSSQTMLGVEFVLASRLDREDMKLPRQIVAKDYCPQKYRVPLVPAPPGHPYPFSSSAYVTCPYTGSDYFTQDGERTYNPEEDACGKTLRDCKLRYGDQPMPFLGFPGVHRW